MKNQDLNTRRSLATPRGVGVMCDFSAVRAENAALWAANGKAYLAFAGGVAGLHPGRRRPAPPRPREQAPRARAAGQLVRVGIDRLGGVRQAHGIQQLQRSPGDFGSAQARVRAKDLADLVADGAQRVQGGHRFLKDHADASATQAAQGVRRQLQQVLPFPMDLSAAGVYALGQQAQDGARRQGLARPAFADHAHDFARVDAQGKVL
ncbi:hypothetical protein G6F31_018318 [Rhizopus arrhizus]|nr:hypothetical protein G6F31_018318 [Rhizopus arrhizus]